MCDIWRSLSCGSSHTKIMLNCYWKILYLYVRSQKVRGRNTGSSVPTRSQLFPTALALRNKGTHNAIIYQATKHSILFLESKILTGKHKGKWMKGENENEGENENMMKMKIPQKWNKRKERKNPETKENPITKYTPLDNPRAANRPTECTRVHIFFNNTV